MHRKKTSQAAALACALLIALTTACKDQPPTVKSAAEASVARTGSPGISDSALPSAPLNSAAPRSSATYAVPDAAIPAWPAPFSPATAAPDVAFIPASAAPSSRATAAAERQAVMVNLQGKSYFFPSGQPGTERYNFAAVAAQGIVWSPAPKMEGKGSNPEWIPLEPFTLYLSDPAVLQLDTSTARKLYTLPLPEKSDQYTKLSSLQGAGDYIVYHTYTMFRGGAQALRNQAWAMKLGDSAQPVEILSFHAAGGYLYYWGLEEQQKLYVSVSQMPGNADGSYSYEVYVYSLEEGVKEKLQKFSLEGGVLEFNYHNQSYAVKLQQG